MNTKLAKKTGKVNVSTKDTLNAKKGLSIVSHLTASLKIKKRQNLEGQAFITENYERKTTKVTNPKGRGKGQIVQKGLTKRGRKTIRVISDCYGRLIQDKNFRDRKDFLGDYDGSSCRFITLTYRNIIPSDTEAKKHLDSFFKRLNRLFGRNVHYIWVAERQKRGAIHFHILTPENISNRLSEGQDLDSKQLRMLENQWVNKAWNDTVKNWSVKSGKITKSQGEQWAKEYDLSAKYYQSRIKFQLGLRTTSPRKPAKSTYLLLPNLVHVFKAGNYMAKYMSKEGQNIIGGMYGASTKSRDFLTENIVCEKSFGYVIEANKAIEYMEHRAKEEKVYVATWQLDHNGAKGLWCSDVYRLQEWYFEYIEVLKYRHCKSKRTIEKALVET